MSKACAKGLFNIFENKMGARAMWHPSCARNCLSRHQLLVLLLHLVSDRTQQKLLLETLCESSSFETTQMC